MKILIAISIFLGTILPISSLFAQNDPSCIEYCNTLLNGGFRGRSENKNLESLLKKIKECKYDQKEERLIEFVKKDKKFGSDALYTLIDLRSKKIGLWLKKEKGKATFHEISAITNQLRRNKGNWRDPLLMSMLIEIGVNTKNADIQHEIYWMFAKIGTLEDAIKLGKIALPENKAWGNSWIHTIQARFKHPKTNPIVQALLTNYKRLTSISFILRRLRVFSRYDFLPELYELREWLKNEKRSPKRIKRAQKVLKKVNQTISALESKKMEKAPIGLPLDWNGQ